MRIGWYAACAALVVIGAIAFAEAPGPGHQGMVTPLLFLRWGGIAGVADRLEVAQDGRLTYYCTTEEKGTDTAVRTVQDSLGNDALVRLVGQLRHVNWSAHYPGPAGPGADRMYYRIEYDRKSLTTREAEIPATLQSVVSLLSDSLERLRRRC